MSRQEMNSFLRKQAAEHGDHVRWGTSFRGCVVVGLSALGLSCDQKQLLVYVHNYVGGSGAYYLLAVERAGLRVVQQHIAWQE